MALFPGESFWLATPVYKVGDKVTIEHNGAVVDVKEVTAVRVFGKNKTQHFWTGSSRWCGDRPWPPTKWYMGPRARPFAKGDDERKEARLHAQELGYLASTFDVGKAAALSKEERETLRDLLKKTQRGTK